MEILLFGIAREIAGESRITIPTGELPPTAGALRSWLKQTYPALGRLSSLAIAVNSVYAADDDLLEADAEIALIPPVSGG